MARHSGRTKSTTKAAKGKPLGRQQSPASDETIADLPDREVMSLLPTGLGSLTGAGLGGGLLGGTGTQPVTPATAPALPDPTSLVSGGSLAGADQGGPIAQQSSTT